MKQFLLFLIQNLEIKEVAQKTNSSLLSLITDTKTEFQIDSFLNSIILQFLNQCVIIESKI